MDVEETDRQKWTPEPKCSCTGKGKPVKLGGEMVVFRDLGCRVHSVILSSTNTPQSVETVVGNWKDKENAK